jgi:acyl transferase domain-containing protein
VNADIEEHETEANNQQAQAVSHNEEVKKYEEIIKQQKQASILQTETLTEANRRMKIKDSEFKNLLSSAATVEDKLSGAIIVIEEKDIYIEKQQKLLTMKDDIIDSQDKKSNELEQAYAHEAKRSEELTKALTKAKTIRQYKWTIGGSYDPINKDWSIEGYRNFKVARVGLSIDQVTVNQNKKEYRPRLHLGINF